LGLEFGLTAKEKLTNLSPVNVHNGGMINPILHTAICSTTL